MPEDFNIGSFIQAILPGVAAIATRRPEAVFNTTRAITAGGEAAEKKRLKAFGKELFRYGANAIAQVVLHLAAKYKVNPKVASEYVQKFMEIKRGHPLKGVSREKTPHY